MLLRLNSQSVRTMNNNEFDFDIAKLYSELEEIEKELELLYPIEESLECEHYDYLDYFQLLENEIPENRKGVYDWLEEWFHTFFGDNLKGSDAYVLYSEDEQWEICIPLKDTTMEGMFHSPSGFETETYHIEFSSDGEYFVGACSKDLLRDLITIFKIWVETKESRITSFSQYRGYSTKALYYLKKLAVDTRIHTRQDAIMMANVYLEGIQMTNDYHMNLLWQLLIQELEIMSDALFLKIKMIALKEKNDSQ